MTQIETLEFDLESALNANDRKVELIRVLEIQLDNEKQENRRLRQEISALRRGRQ